MTWQWVALVALAVAAFISFGVQATWRAVKMEQDRTEVIRALAELRQKGVQPSEFMHEFRMAMSGVVQANRDD